ncbi:MAG: glycerophosphodiester phosphodiesterase family protein [Polyangiaceae bacterium]|nr:glycerophosphodiester phosphodiesterase family protein [Polyangiaceae bacterium]
MRTRTCWCLAALALLAGCGGDEGAAGGAIATGGAAGVAGARGAAGASGAAGAPAISPAEYDCRAAGPPERATPVPASCVLDRGCRDRLVGSHRGAGVPGVLAPENTLAAIRASIAYGIDYVEVDVRATSDGVLVLFHDEAVDRTTRGSGALAALPLAEVQALELEWGTAPYDGDFACERVPTFADALALAKGRVLLIVDGSKHEDTAAIVSAIGAAGALDWAIFDHTDADRVAAAAALEPGLQVQLRATTEAELDARLALLGGRQPVQIHIEGTDPPAIAPAVHARGYRVFSIGFGRDLAAGLGDTGVYAEAYDAGVDALLSNRPELVGAFLGR